MQKRVVMCQGQGTFSAICRRALMRLVLGLDAFGCANEQVPFWLELSQVQAILALLGWLCFFFGRLTSEGRVVIFGVAPVDVGATDLCQLLDALTDSKLPCFVRNACYGAPQLA